MFRHTHTLSRHAGYDVHEFRWPITQILLMNIHEAVSQQHSNATILITMIVAAQAVTSGGDSKGETRCYLLDTLLFEPSLAGGLTRLLCMQYGSQKNIK